MAGGNVQPIEATAIARSKLDDAIRASSSVLERRLGALEELNRSDVRGVDILDGAAIIETAEPVQLRGSGLVGPLERNTVKDDEGVVGSVDRAHAAREHERRTAPRGRRGDPQPGERARERVGKIDVRAERVQRDLPACIRCNRGCRLGRDSARPGWKELEVARQRSTHELDRHRLRLKSGRPGRKGHGLTTHPRGADDQAVSAVGVRGGREAELGDLNRCSSKRPAFGGHVSGERYRFLGLDTRHRRHAEHGGDWNRSDVAARDGEEFHEEGSGETKF